MTNNTNRRNVRTCADCHKQLNRSNCTPAMGHNDMCDNCFEIAGLYNDHQDGHHDDEPVANCEGCGHVIADASRAGHKGSTIPKAMQSHAACYAAGTHEPTKAGRAACRKGRN